VIVTVIETFRFSTIVIYWKLFYLLQLNLILHKTK